MRPRPSGRRRDRVAESVRHEVAAILQFEFGDPRISRATVTRVALAGDLTVARVYVSVLGSEEERAATLGALAGAAGRVRRLLGARLRLRTSPEVRFVFDPAVEFGIRLERMLGDALPPSDEPSPEDASEDVGTDDGSDDEPEGAAEGGER